MGICASCLGLSSHDADNDADLDRILDSEQPSYGAIDRDYGYPQPDEEEVRREREALEHITSAAADHMIDVLHPSHSHLDQSIALANSHRHVNHNHNHNHAVDRRHTEEDGAAGGHDAEEAAWLESVQSVDVDTVRMPKRGNLVMDISLLRDQRPT